MAHIPDGILSLPVLLGGAAVAVAGVGAGLRGLDDRAIPRIAMLSAAFFASALIAIPLGPTSVHLMLGGLMGVMLGRQVFAAVLVALVLQALLFGVGGVTTLGVNTMNIAGPAAAVGAVLGPWVRRAPPARAGMIAGLGAGAAVLATGGLVAVELWLSAPEFLPVARVMGLTYLPLAGVEAAVTGAIVSFLARVAPEALAPALPPAPETAPETSPAAEPAE